MEILLLKTIILESLIQKKTNIIAINKDTSLNLLKVKALKADFKVEILVDQKLIKKKKMLNQLILNLKIKQKNYH